ncbi:nucleoid-structuring protein H-NS [Pseudomonas sp. Lb2C1-1]
MVPRLGSVCPNEGIAPWARREGPSMAQRGYPGIHAGMPTAQYLRSASVV